MRPVDCRYWWNHRWWPIEPVLASVVNYRGAFRSIIDIAIDLWTLEYRHFLWITTVPLSWRCLQSYLHSGSRMRATVLHSRWADHQLCDPSRIIATRCSYCFINPLRPQNCIYLQSHLSCLHKLNCNLFSHHEILYFISQHRPPTTIRLFLLCHLVIAQWTKVPVHWLLHPSCSTKYAALKYSLQSISTFWRSMR